MTFYNANPGDALTGQELRVLYWLSHGLTNVRVGEQMHITVATVKNHVGGVLRKLGANDRAHAVRLGFELGLLRPDTAVAS